MIIRALAAENLLKYRTLRLNDLPERGIIAVSGENETGKSAIGEIICFALFGRTYALDPARLRKLLRWGAPRGAVTMRFAAGGSEYEVQRQLDRDGSESARLSSVDQPDPPLARGPEAVNERLRRLLGFGFDEYVETFYLAQREITAPHPHSPTVKRLTGIWLLERCARDLRQAVERDEQSLRDIETRLAEIEEGLRVLEADSADPTVLKTSVAQTSEREQEVGQRIDQLNAATEAYCEASRRTRMHGFRRGAASLTQSLLLLAVLGVAGIWFLLRSHPRLWPVSALRESLEGLVATPGLPAETAAAYGAVALGILLVLVLIWSLALALQDRKRRARGRRLSGVLLGIDELGTAAGGRVDAKADDLLVPGEVSLQGVTPVDKPDAERRARLARRILALEASPGEVRAATQHESAWLGRLLEELKGQHRILEDAFDRATKNREKLNKNKYEKEILEKKQEVLLEGLGTRRLACKLLEGATERISDLFKRQLHASVGRTLPRLTEGRYGHLEVDGDLQVRVYSEDKRGFLGSDEVSSGMQRQTLLALRFALAEELVARFVKGRQFTFLDEPFAFFDGSRMRSALRLLPELSDNIVQIWVVAQRFPQDVPIALELNCGGHPDILEFGRASAS